MTGFRRIVALALALLAVSARAADIRRPGAVPQIPNLALPATPLTGPSLTLPSAPALPAAPNLPSGPAAVPGIAVPNGPASVSAVPALPAPAITLTVPAGPSASGPASLSGAPSGPSQPGGAPGPLGSLGEALRKAAAENPGSAFSRFFDGSAWVRGEPEDGNWKPRLPSGARGVWVDEVRTGDDLERLIPHGVNSDALIDKLKADLRHMAPYRIFTYRDANGGKFVAVDISQNPKLIEHFPEQQSHEIKLIKKIQLWTKDLQLVVREDGKTPDLVMGGVLTELKSVFPGHDFTFLIDKANRQVTEHAQRHKLGHGAAVVDFVGESQVPVGRVLKELDAWRRTQQDVHLDKIFVFAGLDVKVFTRGANGAYSAADPNTMPLNAPVLRRPATPQDVQAVQLLVKKSRLGEAENRLRYIEEPPAGDPHHALSQARRAVEAERLLGRIAKLVDRSKLDEALDAWQNFVKTHGDEAKAIEPRVREVLPLVDAGNNKKSIAEEPERFVRELEEPGKLLDQAGIDATITAYGSARVEPGSKYYEMARRFAALVARFGGGKVAMITGGGPGIMEAANRGAFEAGGPSIGYNIKLPHEQSANPYLTPGLSYEFEYFASRKMHLRNPRSIGLVYFPGGFGTLDELFEVLTLMQTGKMQRVPIILVGEKDHWAQLLDFDHLVRSKLIAPHDLQLFKFADSAEQAWKLLAESRRAAAK